MSKQLTVEQLDSLFERLFNDAVTANHYLELICDINREIANYDSEFSVSNTFWVLSTRAIREAMYVRLSRIYVGKDNNQNLTLHRLLSDISHNLHLFDKQSFIERLKDNPYVESLSEINRQPSIEDIRNDMNIVCEKNNPLVRKLTIWRHQVYMHSAYSVAKGNKKILEDNSISEEEVKLLVKTAIYTLNKYSSLFKASTYYERIFGHDDFLNTLNLVRLGIEKREQDMQAEAECWNRRIASADKSDN